MDPVIAASIARRIGELAEGGRTSDVKLLLRLAERLEVDRTGCWIWTGALRGGYGRTSANGRYITTHREIWQLLERPLARTETLDHLCRVKGCANPAHLEPVTLAVNVSRSWDGNETAPRPNKNRAKTHCPRGHEYDEDNTYRYASGGRRCRACGREDAAKKRETRAEVVKEQKRAYYLRHAERLREKQRRYNERKRGERA
jgi:hypothetical protein